MQCLLFWSSRLDEAADANIPFWQSHNGIFVELAFGEFGGPNPGGEKVGRGLRTQVCRFRRKPK
jgi:hypothetical protein